MGSNSLDILRARDISLTGLGVYVSHGFEGCDVNSEVELVITLPRTRTFVCKGVIRHVSSEGEPGQYFGVEFTRVTDGNRAKIREYITRAADAGA